MHFGTEKAKNGYIFLQNNSKCILLVENATSSKWVFRYKHLTEVLEKTCRMSSVLK